MGSDRPVRVVFVCAGNICRSPMAEAVFREQVSQAGLGDVIEVASRGTEDWHEGEPPHEGTLAVLDAHGIDARHQRARQIRHRELREYDYVIALDRSNRDRLLRMPGADPARISLLRSWDPAGGELDVPDPYYTGRFQETYELIRPATEALLEAIRRRHLAPAPEGSA
ncbi:MAG: low molecular weight phosphotyrosine protein phosphatase [Firmicutes bacterium]|nr:low molecular weight phosphotyrosine protein phosphatase [Bacillota bacterium]